MTGLWESGPVSGVTDSKGLVPVCILGKDWVGGEPQLVPGVELGKGIIEGPGLGNSGFLGWVGVGRPDWDWDWDWDWEVGLTGLGRPESMEW